MPKLRGNKFETNLRRLMDCVGTVCGKIPWKNPTVLRTTCWNNSVFFHRWWRWMPFLTVYLELVLNHARPLPLSLSFTFFRFKTTLSWRQCVAKRAQRLKMMMRGPTLQMTGSRSSHENAAGSKIKIDSWSPPPPPKKNDVGGRAMSMGPFAIGAVWG